MMDVYHSEFHDRIALDSRIAKISVLIGIEDKSYEEREQAYLRIAAQAGLNGWELDRILYNYTDEVIAGLQ